MEGVAVLEAIALQMEVMAGLGVVLDTLEELLVMETPQPQHRAKVAMVVLTVRLLLAVAAVAHQKLVKQQAVVEVMEGMVLPVA
jgi:hypothetical protein